MKTGILLLSFFLLFFFNAFAQKALYSHQAVRFQYDNELQLVSNVANTHHLLVFRPKQKPVLHVYDQFLKLLAKREIAGIMPQNCDIQILQSEDHYFLFTHVPKTSKYQCWKIDARGMATDMLPQFNNLKEQFKDTFAAIQVNTDNRHIFLVTQVFYPQLGVLIIERIKADNLLQSMSTKQIAFDFDPEKEGLCQVVTVDENHLLLLKRSKNDQADEVLEIMKCDLQSGKIQSTHFSIGQNFFSQPAIHFNPGDSTIFMYSMIREPLLVSKVKRSVLMCKLDYLLKPLVPPTVIKASNLFSFILVNHVNTNWLHLPGGRQSVYPSRTMTNYYAQNLKRGTNIPVYNYEMQLMQQQIYLSEFNNPNVNRIRFYIVDEQFKVVSDSLLQIDEKGFTIYPANFGKVRVGNKSYLIFEQQLPDKSNGLLLVTGKDNNKIEINDLPVYNRYHYFLAQLQQTGDGNFIMPYINKKEVGLMKLKLD